MSAEREEAGGVAERLRRAGEILKDSSLAADFPEVSFGAARAMKIPAGGNGVAAAEWLAGTDGPVRLSLGPVERFLPEGGTDPAAAELLDREVRSLREAAGASEEPVLLRETAGSRWGERIYPVLSGLLLLENYYPVSYMKPEEGIAYVRLGLGRGNRASLDALRFSPAHPELMPDFSTPEDMLRNAQRTFSAVDPDGEGGAADFDLETARRDGALAPVGSVYSRENGTVTPGVRREGIRLVTFAPMLRGRVFPLAPILSALLALFREASPEPLAIEFAADLRDPPKGDPHRFVLEGIRPLIGPGEDVRPGEIDEEGGAPGVVCGSGSTLGHGPYPGLRDILCVCPDRFDVSRSREIAGEVGEENARLVEEGRPYVLIGSGRWGTSDRWLGIPVAWEQVSGARIQVEAGLEEFNVESSRGTHFFREMTYHGVGAMHIGPGRAEDRIDWEWLQLAPALREGTFVRRIALDEPLRVRIDGRAGRGIIRRPS